MFSNSNLTPADVMALSGNDGGFGGNGSWLWFLVIIFLLGGWNQGGIFGGGRNGSATDGYILTSDFANIERKIDGVNNGLCEGFYTQAQLVNGVNSNIANAQYAISSAIVQDTIGNMQNTNAIGAQITSLSNQMQNCCCENRQQISDLKYTMATENCATRQAIADSTKAIIDKITADKIESLTTENNALRLQASQVAQNNYLVSQLRPTPVPAYYVQNPYGYGYYGTTIS